MPNPGPHKTTRRHVTRRDFLKRAGWTGAGATALLVGARPGRAAAAAEPYPDWIPPSTKSPKRGGVLNRAAPWDPPTIDPRLTQSIGTFQFVGLTSSRLIRYAFPEEAAGTNDLSLKGDPRGVLAGEPRLPDVDLQDSSGGQVAQHPAAERARAHRRRCEVLLRAVRERGAAVLHVPRDRRNGDARQVHAAGAPGHAQRAVPAERGRIGHRDLRPRGPRRGR